MGEQKVAPTYDALAGIVLVPKTAWPRIRIGGGRCLSLFSTQSSHGNPEPAYACCLIRI